MDHVWARVGSNLIARVSGPMKFRLLLQPLMSSFFAIRAGLADAKLGKPPYFWALLSTSGDHMQMIKDGWKSVGGVFIVALVLDAVYQVIELRFIYPGEAIIVALVLAIVPYLVVRGLATRLARRRKPDIGTTDKRPRMRRAA
jgi:hypothetical protein